MPKDIPPIIASAIRVSLLVGTILTAINHGAALLNGDVHGRRWVQVVLCYVVPFLVSFFSQVQMKRRLAQPGRRDAPEAFLQKRKSASGRLKSSEPAASRKES